VKGAARLRFGLRAEKFVTRGQRVRAAKLLLQSRDLSTAAKKAWQRGAADEAFKLWDEAAKAESAIRAVFADAELGRSLDRADAAIAAEMGLSRNAMQRTSSFLPADLGRLDAGLHMSVRRQTKELRIGRSRTLTVTGPSPVQYNPAVTLRAFRKYTDQVAPLARGANRARINAMRAATVGLTDPVAIAKASRRAAQTIDKTARARLVAIMPIPPRAVDDALSGAQRQIRGMSGVAGSDEAAKIMRDLGSSKSAELLWKDPNTWFQSLFNRRGKVPSWAALKDSTGNLITNTPEAIARSALRTEYKDVLMNAMALRHRAATPEIVFRSLQTMSEELVRANSSRARAADILADMVKKGATKGDPEELRRLRTEALAGRVPPTRAPPAAGPPAGPPTGPPLGPSRPGAPLPSAGEGAIGVAHDLDDLIYDLGLEDLVIDTARVYGINEGTVSRLITSNTGEFLLDLYVRGQQREVDLVDMLVSRIKPEVRRIASVTGDYRRALNQPYIDSAMLIRLHREIELREKALGILAENEWRKLKAVAPTRPMKEGPAAMIDRFQRLERVVRGEDVPQEVIDGLDSFFRMIGADRYMGQTRFRISKLKGKKLKTAGYYAPAMDLLVLNRRILSSPESLRTMIHETFHAISRHVPTERLDSLFRQYERELIAYKKARPFEFDKAGKRVPLYATARNYRYTSFDEWFAESMLDLSMRRLKTWDEANKTLLGAFMQLIDKIRAKTVKWLGFDELPNLLEDLVAGRIDSPAVPSTMRKRYLEWAQYRRPVTGAVKRELKGGGPLAASARGMSAAERSIRATPLPVASRAHGSEESTLVDTLRNILEGPGKTRAAVRAAGVNTMFGGDQWRLLRHLPEKIRYSILAGGRYVEQAISDITLLLLRGREIEWAKVHNFLDGAQVQSKEGRHLVSSGFDSSSAIASHVKQAWDEMASKAQEALMTAAQARERLALPEEIQEAVAKAAGSLLRGRVPTSGSKVTPPPLWFMRDLSEALGGVPKAAPGASEVIADAREIELVLGTLRWAGVPLGPSRGGDLSRVISPLSASGSKGFLDMVEGIYGKADRSRAAVLMAAHGHADKARMLWTGALPGLGADTLGVPRGAAEAFKGWVLGKRVDPKAMPVVHGLAARFGINPHFIDEPLLGGKVYLPLEARTQLASKISRGMERFDPMLGVLAAGDEQVAVGAPAAILRYVKLRMTRGAVIQRPRYYLMNTFDHFNQLAIQPGIGFKTALISTLRLMPQNLLVAIPGAPHLLYFAQRGTEAAQRAGRLAAPSTAVGQALLTRGNIERFRALLQRGGDKTAHAVQRILGGGKYHLNVNDVLEGKAGSMILGSGPRARRYTYAELRSIALQEGIFASFDASQLSNAIRKTILDEAQRLEGTLTPKALTRANDAFRDLIGLTTEMGEACAERERLGTMLTLIEAGATPRDAARLTVKALYDYAGSMTKGDRSFLVSLFVPFWAYHKNANSQTINSMFSARGAWASGVLRRATRLGPKYLSDALYASMYEPYGVDVEAMSVDGRASYWTLRHIVENGMGPPETWAAGIKEDLERQYGPVDTWDEETREFAINGYGGFDNVPPTVRLTLRAIFAGQDQFIHQGRLYQLGAYIQNMGAMETKEGAMPPPDPTARRSYRRGMAGITVPVPPSTNRWVQWYYKDAGPDAVYTELYIPESTMQAGMRHVSGMIATWALLGQFILSGTGFYEPIDPETGIEAGASMAARNLRDTLFEVVEPTRAPLARDVASVFGFEGPPTRLHPTVAAAVQSIFPGVQLRKHPATGDPMAPAEAATQTDEWWYLPPGMMSLIFEVTPALAEINSMLIAGETSPLEETAVDPRDPMGLNRRNMLKLARIVGFQTAETQRSATLKAEEPRFTRSTTTPPPSLE